MKRLKQDPAWVEETERNMPENIMKSSSQDPAWVEEQREYGQKIS